MNIIKFRYIIERFSDRDQSIINAKLSGCSEYEIARIGDSRVSEEVFKKFKVAIGWNYSYEPTWETLGITDRSIEADKKRHEEFVDRVILPMVQANCSRKLIDWKIKEYWETI